MQNLLDYVLNKKIMCYKKAITLLKTILKISKSLKHLLKTMIFMYIAFKIFFLILV